MNPNKWKEFKHMQEHPKQYSALRRKKKEIPKIYASIRDALTKEIRMNKLDGLTAHLKELAATLAIELDKALAGNKAAARRARKATLDIAKVGKEYRAESVAKIG